MEEMSAFVELFPPVFRRVQIK